MVTFGFSVHTNPGYIRFVPLILYWIVDENKEGDGYIWVQCSYKPWLHTVCAING